MDCILRAGQGHCRFENGHDMIQLMFLKDQSACCVEIGWKDKKRSGDYRSI